MWCHAAMEVGCGCGVILFKIIRRYLKSPDHILETRTTYAFEKIYDILNCIYIIYIIQTLGCNNIIPLTDNINLPKFLKLSKGPSQTAPTITADHGS